MAPRLVDVMKDQVVVEQVEVVEAMVAEMVVGVVAAAVDNLDQTPPAWDAL